MKDIEDMTNIKVGKVLKEISSQFQRLIEESDSGKIIKNGLNVAIIGKPNVGKSSILNSLLEENKAIVTDIEGTTRDIVEGKIILNGQLVNFIDTAGIRKTDDVVEKIGVDKSLEQLKSADLIILVLNYNEKLNKEERDLLKAIKEKKYIIFINKNDLNKKIDLIGGENIVYGNTVAKDGLDELKKKITKMFSLGDISKKDFTYISNARQLSLIKRAKKAIDSAIKANDEKLPVDLIEIDIANARNLLSEILGEVYNDELLDELFSKFCLGK